VLVASKPADITGFMVEQTYAATTTGPRVGTKMLMGCTGIVIHDANSRRGVLAHVEARTEKGQYVMEIVEALQLMSDRLGALGTKGRVEVVFLGNLTGMGQDHEGPLKRAVYRELQGFNVGADDVMDLRNRLPPDQRLGTRVGNVGLASCCM